MNRRSIYHQDAAIVLLSGGQDSTTCLYWAKATFAKVEALIIDYGQRHAVEVEQAMKICELAGITHVHTRAVPHVLEGSTLTNIDAPTDRPHPINLDLPSSFTPARNAFFLTIAANIAYTRSIGDIVTGVCQTDYSGYPDCRETFIKMQEAALRLALDDDRLRIHTPLMYLTKAETWKMAADMGVLDVIVEHTHTDYHGDRTQRNEWGYGKLDNPASQIRANGYFEAKANGWLS